MPTKRFILPVAYGSETDTARIDPIYALINWN